MSQLAVTSLAVFGNPIAHSLSPLIHKYFAQATCCQIDYRKILVDQPFATCAQEFFAHGGYGCNITVPCKFDAYSFAQERSIQAQISKAVNTLVKRQRDNGSVYYYGDTTDGPGLVLALENLDVALQGSNVLLIGAGGAAAGVVPALIDAKVAGITVVNRTLSKAHDLVMQIMTFYLNHSPETELPQLQACTYEALNASYQGKSEAVGIPARYEVVLNATSLSMHQELPAIDDSIVAAADVAYDLYYTPEGKTVFTQHASKLGCKHCFDGLTMLVGQAAFSYQLWFGKMPPILETMEYLRAHLKR